MQSHDRAPDTRWILETLFHFHLKSARMAARFETRAEFILSLPKGALLSGAAILRVPEEGP
jgi:hypothetical protein